MSTPTRKDLLDAIQHTIDLLEEAQKETPIRETDIDSAIYILTTAISGKEPD
jgi:hypothetical protein